MRLHYYSRDWPKGLKNLGDWLTVPILQAMGYTIEPPEDGKPVLFGVGSTIGDGHFRLYPNSPIHVWGSGLMNRSHAKQWDRVRFHAVRGPLTRDTLKLNVPLGDPALLLPRLIELPRPDQMDQVLYVNHCGTQPLEHPGGFDAAVTMLVPEANALDLISRIAHSRFVASESLHGCVIAAAYGVPWAPCSTKTHELSDKWNDWFAYLGLPHQSRPLPAVPEAARIWWETVGSHARLQPCNDLLEVLPGTL